MSDKIQQFITRIQFVKKKDLLHLFPMTLSYIYAQFFKLRHRNIWLICEREYEARDNGYWFFKYMRENHPEIEAVYAISKKSEDVEKVASLGKIIDFGSFNHWVYYWAAKKNLSSQKEGKPNAALCYVLEVYLGARKNRIYLKHGITKDFQRWIFKDISKINLMLCASPREMEYIEKCFGYQKDELALTGLARYDNLNKAHKTKSQVLIMPTMREWLRALSSETNKYEQSRDVSKSEYVVVWNSLLSNPRLYEILVKNNMDLVFYPHNGMQKYYGLFKSPGERIIIANSKHYEVQSLLMESAMLVTDYSSIYFDFSYMKKPLVYYHFDYEKYREGQYQEGYFSYQNDGFGPIVQNEDSLINLIEQYVEAGMEMPKEYSDRVDEFFAYRDDQNCERIYQAVITMK